MFLYFFGKSDKWEIMPCYSRVVNFGFDEAKMRNGFSFTALMMLLMMFSQRSREPSTDWGLFLKFQNSTVGLRIKTRKEKYNEIVIWNTEEKLVFGVSYTRVSRNPWRKLENPSVCIFTLFANSANIPQIWTCRDFQTLCWSEGESSLSVTKD